ncbi:hypothetical protein [uncultured Flavobacterium sp.]|mgnify:FL=1|uniref:hypothetical protein n=1 Tax=uncultured Flavobacterium sp. TaxID=165435 RepID=UPI00259695B3|nr:hypothetical protein [uncultured Flavobacterium sp.]
MKKVVLIFVWLWSCGVYAQSDTIPGEAAYRKHYDCRYEEGNVLLVQKKGKTLDYATSWGVGNAGFVIRMEAIYDLEFANGKRYRSGVIKNITTDSISISTTMNANCAEYEGIPYKIDTYALQDIKIARFVNDASLGLFTKKKIDKDYELVVQKVPKAKLCPALLTFPKRDNEIKVCHYILTKQGYSILFETNGFLDYMEYPITWN